MNKEQEIQKVRDLLEDKEPSEKVAVIIFTINEIEGVMSLKKGTMCLTGEDAFSKANRMILRSVAIGMAASLVVAEETLKGEAK